MMKLLKLITVTITITINYRFSLPLFLLTFENTQFAPMSSSKGNTLLRLQISEHLFNQGKQ